MNFLALLPTVKPRLFAARSSVTTADHESTYSSATSSLMGSHAVPRPRRRSIVSITDATKIAKKGVQDTVGIANDLASKMKPTGRVMDALMTNFAVKKISYDKRAAWNARMTSPQVRVAIKVKASNLPQRNTKHANAFCVLWEVPSGYAELGKPSALPRPQEHEVGRTEVVRETQYPSFTERFEVDYKFEREQTFLIRVYDEDLGYTQKLSEHYYIGGYVFTLQELLGRPTHKISTQIDFESEASIVLQGLEVETARKFLEIRIAAHGLTTSDSVMSKNDPYFMVERYDYEDKAWIPVWKSETVYSTHNPVWSTATLSLLALCGGDMEADIRVTFWESHTLHEDQYLGCADTTIDDLSYHVPNTGVMFPIHIKRKYFFGAGNKLQKTGRMQILKSGLVERPSFLQYLKGGCEFNLIVAVDCEAGIDHKDETKAKQFVHGSWQNNYQAALEKIGVLMESYSRSHHFQMWGFNAQVGVEDEESIFIMNKKVTGKRGLLKTYEKWLLGGNRFIDRQHEPRLGPLITKVMYQAIKESERRHCYSLLCVLTSGKAADLKTMMDSINRAATDAPMSIVFIGCEDMGLDTLQHYFERNKIQRSISGVRLSRECASFTSFAECDNDASNVIAEGFRELPEQMVQRFFAWGVNPKSPPKVEPGAISNVHHNHHHHPKQEALNSNPPKSHGDRSKSPRHRERQHQHKKKQSPSRSPERRKKKKSPERGHRKSPDRPHRLRVKPGEIDF